MKADKSGSTVVASVTEERLAWVRSSFTTATCTPPHAPMTGLASRAAITTPVVSIVTSVAHSGRIVDNQATMARSIHSRATKGSFTSAADHKPAEFSSATATLNGRLPACFRRTGHDNSFRMQCTDTTESCLSPFLELIPSTATSGNTLARLCPLARTGFYKHTPC